MRIFNTYGAEAIEMVRADPYRLARDIRGIGFLSADTIAQKLGIARDSPLRARAGVSHALAEAASEGHCGLPHADLVPLAVKLLEIAPDVIEAAIAQEIEDGVLVPETIEGQPCVFLALLHQAERSIAAQVARLKTQAAPWPAIDAEKAMAWVCSASWASSWPRASRRRCGWRCLPSCWSSPAAPAWARPRWSTRS